MTRGMKIREYRIVSLIIVFVLKYIKHMDKIKMFLSQKHWDWTTCPRF